MTDPETFDAGRLAALDEPVRRYFSHAIRSGAPLAPAVRIGMTGRIRVGAWLPFTAVEQLDGRSFAWSARVGSGRLTLLRAEDRFAAGTGSMTIRLGGRLTVMRATGPDTDRSAAARAAIEALWSPAALLPDEGVVWRAEGDDHVVAALDVPPEHPELHFLLDERGAVRAAWTARWRDGRYVPCGAEVRAERRFGDLTVPSELTVAWGFGTPAATPFFSATVQSLVPATAVAS